MLEAVIRGSRGYWTLICCLLAIIGVGVAAYIYQFTIGLGVTGMSRDVSWGLYIGQFTFLVGVAASGVMVVLPYYLHNYKAFGRITVLGEFLAIASVLMCMLFIFVDLGQPLRVLNVLLHPSPNSVMFYDMLVLSGYLLLNVLVGWTVLGAERKGIMAPSWVKPFIIISIAWAPSIHTVTAFLYAGIPGRHLWLTAIMAARFLASAFSGGPALLLLLALILRKYTKFDPGQQAIQTLAKIITYFMITSVFFLGLEFFTAFYSQIPGHMHPLVYLYVGLHGHSEMMVIMWTSTILAVVSLVLLVPPKFRKNETLLPIACAATFLSLWLEKGLGLIVGGFVPNPFEGVTGYLPTLIEITIALGVWAIGFLVLTLLYKTVVTVKEEVVFDKYGERQIKNE
jgi:molybdopterin-containing oxidoreductase family membrane subunit